MRRDREDTRRTHSPDGRGPLGPLGRRETPAHLGLLSASLETLHRVPADRLQYLVSLRPVMRLSAYEGLIHQCLQSVQYFFFQNHVTSARRLRRFQPPAAGEHGQPVEYKLLSLRQQVVAPFQRGA